MAPTDTGGTLECRWRLLEVLGTIDRIDPAQGEELRAEWDGPRPTDAAGWPCWTDARPWADGPSGMPLAVWLAAQARAYRSLDSDAGNLVAATLDDLAVSVGSVTPPGRSIDPAPPQTGWPRWMPTVARTVAD
jgi:hypothetical protein